MKKLTLLRNHISESNELDESEKIKLFRFLNTLSQISTSDETSAEFLNVARLNADFGDMAKNYQPHEKYREMRSLAIQLEHRLIELENSSIK